MKKFLNTARIVFSLAIILIVFFFGYNLVSRLANEKAILKQVITRLEADSRTAEVLVTGVNYDEKTGKNLTTIKFMEYDVNGHPMKPQYFTFAGNIIQFQALVIRFDDVHVREGDQLKGKSAYLFWKVFMLDGKNTQEYPIAHVNEIPEGYRIDKEIHPYEARLWREFWRYALDPKMRAYNGIKNAQIEAPGTMFVPGILYTIKIEHDGGLRIDSSPLSPILQGERIPVVKGSQGEDNKDGRQ